MNPKGLETIQPQAPPTTGTIPYYPGLKEFVPSLTAAIVVTYLETRFPAPPNYPGLPVTVSPETVCKDLRVSRRTLGLSLHAIARVYREEADRWRGARAYREFIQQHHRKKGTRKLYSIVCDYNLERAHTFILRRNIPLLRAAFANAGISMPLEKWAEQSEARNITPTSQNPSELTKGAVPSLLVSAPRTLAEIMLQASQLSGDRRSLRYPRLRKAAANGLESPDVLKVKRAKRKPHLPNRNEAVEPDLPQELVDRLIHLPKDEESG